MPVAATIFSHNICIDKTQQTNYYKKFAETQYRCMFKNHTFHILRFLLLFSGLTIAFYCYIGIVSPGGKTYSLFLDRYANFPAWLTYFICKSAKGLLQLIGYDVYQKKPNNVTITGGRGVNIIWACLGFGVMSFWVAFVAAHYAKWLYKLKWIFAGVALITGINILRIALIALALHHNWKAFMAIEPHLAFNVVSYIAIIALAVWFAFRYKRHEEIRSKNHNKAFT